MRKVAIVEDDFLQAMMIEEALEEDGYQVIEMCGTVEHALEAIRRCEPDVAILDIRLATAGMGTEVGIYLRKSTMARIVYSTGSTDIVLSWAEGDAVLNKPYRVEDLARALQIIEELSRHGQTELIFPSSLWLLQPGGYRQSKRKPGLDFD